MICVSRTCTEVLAGGESVAGIPLASLRDRPAYVLLGEPGAGKTTSFDAEAAAAGARRVSARDFVDLPPEQDWAGKPLFIDGLDEMRAGATDQSTPLNDIRKKLIEIGRPDFRLSCREADWLASDRASLERVTRSGISVFHLDPLTNEQIETILRNAHGVENPAAFLATAAERGLSDLLRNPQNLAMLAKAVEAGWPDSLAETFERACRQLAQESNAEHRKARRRREVSVDRTLDAAGQLCAVQLLAGVAGFALDLDAASAAYQYLTELGIELADAHHCALDCRLFDGRGQLERREPSHRRIAEFLAARHIAGRVELGGLPLGRVRSILSAADGGVVSDLRGLHAWLAVHCLRARAELIDADPLGTVLYGDAGRFSPDDKRRLLRALEREAQRFPWFRSADWQASPFGALADRDSVPMLREIIDSPDRSHSHESLLDCVLAAVRHASHPPDPDPNLLALVRDESHWPVNRTSALAAYIRTAGKVRQPLRSLLDEIDAGAVTDSDDELAGLLLEALYPEQVAPEDVLRYLHPSKNPSLLGTYRWFWIRHLLARTPAAGLPSMADCLAAMWPSLLPSLDDHHVRDVAGTLLVAALEGAGATSDPERIWAWLGIGLDEHGHCSLDHAHGGQIADWLSERPAVLQTLLSFGYAQIREQTDPWAYLIDLDQRMRDARLPAAAIGWQFEQAAAFESEDARSYLFNRAAMAALNQHDYTPALLEVLASIADHHPALRPNVDAWLNSTLDDRRRENHRRKTEREREASRHESEWQDFARKNYDKIETGTAHPKTMNDLAMVYFGRFRDAKGKRPEERLQVWFGNDLALAQAAGTGLRRTLDRSDLPPVSEIVKLAKQGRHHYIAEACLAGAEIRFAAQPQDVLNLSEPLLARLVAFRYTHDFEERPAWFRVLILVRPRLIADVLVTYASAMIKARKEHVAGLYPLAFDDEYQAIARLAVLDLLAAYPTRASRSRIHQLENLLVAGLRHADRGALSAMVADRIARRGLDVAQRGQWLCAGLLLDPECYEGQLVAFLQKGEARSLLIAGFFSDRVLQVDGLPDLSEEALLALIRGIGSHTWPEKEFSSGFVTAGAHAAGVVRTLIARLGSLTTDSADAAFATLIADDTLRSWHDRLRQHRESQRVARREAQFSHPPAAAVARLLRNGPPANPADLKALLSQHIRDLARSDRDGDTPGYQRYWNQEPPTHMLENYCRDRLLELLKERIRPQGIDAIAEGRYSEDSRADIRACYAPGGFNVPIEIKRDTHKDLWKAVHQQLIAKYARHPGADGNGIYLVFWFGLNGMPVAADGGKPPASAADLETRLRGLLNEQERCLIDVVVLDCAKPPSRTSRTSAREPK